jgi:parvulin-like peptidyl-prolyl isomerase
MTPSNRRHSLALSGQAQARRPQERRMIRPLAAFALIVLAAPAALAQTITSGSLPAPAPAIAQAPAPDDASMMEAGPTLSAEDEARLRARGEAYHRAPDEAQTPEELQRTMQLNADIAARNDAAAKQESVDQAAYAQARADYEASIERGRAERLNYEESLRASEAAQRQYQADRARWEQRTRDCAAGVRAACLQPGE